MELQRQERLPLLPSPSPPPTHRTTPQAIPSINHSNSKTNDPTSQHTNSPVDNPQKKPSGAARLAKVQGNQKHLFIVDGAAKTGKTTLATEIVPLLVAQAPKYRNVIAISVELAGLAFEGNPNRKLEGLIRKIVSQLNMAGIDIEEPKDFEPETFQGMLYAIKKRVLLTIDQFHFMFSSMILLHRLKMASWLKSVFLDQLSPVDFIVTGSQPFLWISLDYALTRGTGLLHSPTILSTSSFDELDVIGVAFNKFMKINCPTFSPLPNEHPVTQVSTCAHLVQVLRIYNTNGQNLPGALNEHERNRVATNRTDIMYFCLNEPGVAHSVYRILEGSLEHPFPALQQQATEKWMFKTTDSKYRQRDHALAAAVRFVADDQRANLQSVFTLLFPLVIIASCLDFGEPIALEKTMYENLNSLCVSSSEWQTSYAWLHQNQLNSTHFPTEPTWMDFIRMSHKILVHDPTQNGENIQGLMGLFMRAFSSRYNIALALNRALKLLEHN
eukprot:Phypoly_transcript_05176.p1 GENE.Phypoly_transcript_05176~~Phypoly_transcript_05176.p1  ORF type:complete len:499 (+),score=59.25 Phypoly_transcript_05176:370-1866(+)